LPLIALKIEGLGKSQEMQVDFRGWKRGGNRFFPRVFEKEHHPTDTLILA
jgi:hypothetical protein